jgi:hypothetical protein
LWKLEGELEEILGECFMDKFIFLLLLLLIAPVTAEIHQYNDNITIDMNVNEIDNLTYYINQTWYFDNVPSAHIDVLCNYNATMPYNINFKYGLISITGSPYPIHHTYQNGYLIIMVHYRG